MKQTMVNHGVDDVLKITLLDDDLGMWKWTFVPWVEADWEP